MKNKKERELPTKYAFWIYAIERLAQAVEDVTDTAKTVLTNPFGIGEFLKLVGSTSGRLKYVPVLVIGAVVTFSFSVYFGSSQIGLTTVYLFSGLCGLLIVFDAWEALARRRKK